MRHKENIFDLFNSQNKQTKPQEAERVPDEVRPEDLRDPAEVPPEEQKDQGKPEDPGKPRDPEPEKQEGGNNDGT